MNIKEYIGSGIIEAYVLGLASPSERAEFERLCAQYPELVAARREFEEGLEKHASEQAMQPPVGVKGKVLEAITGAQGASEPVSSNPPKITTMGNEKRGSSGLLGFIAAISVILLVVLAWFTYRSYKQNKDLESRNAALNEKLNSTQKTLDAIVDETSIVKNPNTTIVNMVGTKGKPRSSANVYWDSTTSNVYLVVKNMPQLPSDKQYQLWALIDGKPTDLGVFDSKSDKVILKMKDTKKAQAFAITIEKAGGNPTPTLDSMQSSGKTMQSQ
ncbi:MAG TPA: anti-sigma factor [Puia sp.]